MKKQLASSPYLKRKTAFILWGPALSKCHACLPEMGKSSPGQGFTLSWSWISRCEPCWSTKNQSNKNGENLKYTTIDQKEIKTKQQLFWQCKVQLSHQLPLNRFFPPSHYHCCSKCAQLSFLIIWKSEDRRSYTKSQCRLSASSAASYSVCPFITEMSAASNIVSKLHVQISLIFSSHFRDVAPLLTSVFDLD